MTTVNQWKARIDAVMSQQEWKDQVVDQIWTRLSSTGLCRRNGWRAEYLSNQLGEALQNPIEQLMTAVIEIMVEALIDSLPNAPHNLDMLMEEKEDEK